MRLRLKDVLDFKNVKVVSFGIRNLSQTEMTFYKKIEIELKFFGLKIKKLEFK